MQKCKYCETATYAQETCDLLRQKDDVFVFYFFQARENSESVSGIATRVVD